MNLPCDEPSVIASVSLQNNGLSCLNKVSSL